VIFARRCSDLSHCQVSNVQLIKDTSTLKMIPSPSLTGCGTNIGHASPQHRRTKTYEYRLRRLQVHKELSSAMHQICLTVLKPSRNLCAIKFNVHKLLYNVRSVGRDSSVGIATGYVLDGLGIEFRWRRDFPHLSRPALETTQPPVQCVPSLFRG
jgi:hypothetical protein